MQGTRTLVEMGATIFLLSTYNPLLLYPTPDPPSHDPTKPIGAWERKIFLNLRDSVTRFLTILLIKRVDKFRETVFGSNLLSQKNGRKSRDTVLVP